MSALVHTPFGTVRGRTGGVRRFLGIPYAAPLTGAAAFAAPAPTSWSGVFDAVEFGPPAQQFSPMGAIALEPHREGEDRLTLNITTPEHCGDEPLPVMVWIHGGAYVLGSSAEPTYSGLPYTQGRCVFVSLNYRLGLEGFALLEDAPANRGLLDVVAALAWIRDAIAAFGGDPERVTVFGESAGAGIIHCLLTMPQARGLFHRAILQSPPNMVLSRRLAEDIAEHLRAAAASAGLDTRAEDFAALSPEQRTALMRELSRTAKRNIGTWGPAAAFEPPLTPVVDGTVLPADPWQALREAPPHIPAIVGSTVREFALFQAFSRTTPNLAAAERALTALGPADTGYRQLIAGEPAAVWERVNTDSMFTVPALDIARALPGARVYALDIAPRGGIGAAHTVDLPLIFDDFTTGMASVTFPQGPTEAERLAGEHMRRAWMEFARTGEAGWPAFDDGTAWTVSAQPAVGPHPLLERWQCFAERPAAALTRG